MKTVENLEKTGENRRKLLKNRRKVDEKRGKLMKLVNTDVHFGKCPGKLANTAENLGIGWIIDERLEKTDENGGNG